MIDCISGRPEKRLSLSIPSSDINARVVEEWANGKPERIKSLAMIVGSSYLGLCEEDLADIFCLAQQSVNERINRAINTLRKKAVASLDGPLGQIDNFSDDDIAQEAIDRELAAVILAQEAHYLDDRLLIVCLKAARVCVKYSQKHLETARDYLQKLHYDNEEKFTTEAQEATVTRLEGVVNSWAMAMEDLEAERQLRLQENSQHMSMMGIPHD